MPNYDFTCVPCDSTVEIHMAFDAMDRPTCSKCGNFMTKVWTPPAVQFKGGGWGGQG
jgi:putative FmdB family regulatory protein